MLPIKLTSIALELNWLRGIYDIYLTAYPVDDTPAIFLTEMDSLRQEIVVTRNMSGYGVTPDTRCVFVKDYDENRGILETLIKEGLFEPTGRLLDNNLVKFPEVKILLTDEQWAEFDKRFPKRN